jgi:RNA polymerase sigma factor for flagellar operon FliA
MDGNQVRRRARSTAGNNPPRIDIALASLANVAHSASVLADCCSGIDPHTLIEEVLLPSLRTRLEDEASEVILSAGRLQLVNHFQEHHLATGPAKPGKLGKGRNGRWRSLTEMDIASELAKAWRTAKPTGTLEQTITSATQSGLDGELMAWEIIIRESHKHLGLIKKEISKLLPNLPDTDPDDLLGYGWRGLRVALRQYDPALGNSFATYACPKINGAIRDGIRQEHYLPKRLTTFARRITSAEEKLTQELSRTPSFKEISAYLEESEETMRLASRLGHAASLEEMSNPWGEGSSEPNCLIDMSDTSESAIRQVQSEELSRALDDLPEQGAELIRMLYYQESTLTAAAGALGIDVRGAREIRDRSLNQLKDSMSSWVKQDS